MLVYKCLALLVLLKSGFSSSEMWQDTNSIICPNQCTCQYAHFMDLSIARWINNMHMGRLKQTKPEDESRTNDNEVSYENDESYLTNPFLKIATCIFQTETEPKEFFELLPHDIQALVLIYAGEGVNKTVPTSNLKSFSDLSSLEIRGTKDRSFQLLIDEPLSSLQNANFESIQLIGNEFTKRPKNPVHPSESFDYVPNSERIGYNISLETEEEVEILPYDVYMMEVKKSRLASFYEWDNLEVLRIHDCKLDELYWEMFDGLSALQHLSLEHNEIKIIPAFALYGALHIKTLSLARNSILDLNYRSLAGLLDLEILDLSHNNIAKLSELTFPPFPKLEYIDFRHNPIKYIFPATFGVMNTTKTIFLGSDEVELELLGNDPFEFLEVLKFVSITNVTVSSLDQSIFKSLKSLETLRLKGTVNKIEFDAFVHMKNLQKIDMSDCNLREISMDAFIGCKNLESVDLSKNRLSYIPPGLFDDQRLLKEVYLHNNALRFLPSTFFSNPSLKLVRLNGNPWKCTCDMVVWKPSVTNRQRGVKQERCIKDFHTGTVISCRKFDSYKINNKLAPRCSNIKGRSVYYALRKDLQCDFKKELESHIRQQHRGLKRGSKFKHLEEIVNAKEKSVDQTQTNDASFNKRAEWKQDRATKILNTIRSMNSLQSMSSRNHFNSSQNHALGVVDEHDSFNYI